MDGNCPRCGNGAVPVEDGEQIAEIADNSDQRVAFQEAHWNGMVVYHCLWPDCELLFIIHPDNKDEDWK